MKIAVLIKETPDTYGARRMDVATGRVDRNASDRVIDEVSERALEAALQYKDTNKQAEIVVITMAPAAATKSLRKALAMGATSAVHVTDEALTGADIMETAAVLEAVLRQDGYDLILAGDASTDGRGGVLPVILAERLGLPAATLLDEVVLSATDVAGARASDDGIAHVRVDLPAVVSITERNPEARFPTFKGTMTAKKKPLAVINGDSLDIGQIGDTTRVITVAERPARAAGTKVNDDGSAVAQLADYLASRHLI